MKNLMKVLCPLFVIFGIFVVLGSVSAENNTEMLQPAEAVYFEPVWIGGPGSYLVVNASSYFNGVSHINGTIINDRDAVTIGDHLRVDGSIYRVEPGGEHPVAFVDDVRVDGEIFRTEKGGGDPVKINDDLRVLGKIQSGDEGERPIIFNGSIIPAEDGYSSDYRNFNVGSTTRPFEEVHAYNGYFGTLNTRSTLSADKLRFQEGVDSDKIIIQSMYTETHPFKYFKLYANGDIETDGTLTVSNNATIDSLTATTLISSNATINGSLTVNGSGDIERNLDVGGYLSDGTSDSSLRLDDMVNIAPRTGTPPECNSSRRGDIIFNRTAIGMNGEADRFYGCTGSSWTMF